MARRTDTTSPRNHAIDITPKAESSKSSKFTVARAVKAIRSRWMFIACGIGLTTALALVLSSFLAKKTWEASTTLLYTALPISEESRSLYTQPDLKTLSSLVTSPEVIESIRKEFKITAAAKAIEKNLTVTIPSGTKMITIVFRWDDGPKSVEMLNRLATEFMANVTQIRRRNLASHLTDFERALGDIQGRHRAAIKVVTEFHGRENISDYKNDLGIENTKIVNLNFLLEQHVRTETDVLAQIKRMEEHLEEVKAQQLREAELSKQFDAATETVADNRRRQDRLRELIQEERRIQEIQVQLDAKRAELDRVKKLHAKQFASLSQLQEIEAEVNVLISRIKDGEKIRGWQKEMEKIDNVVVPEGAKKNVGSPIIQQVLFRQLELELQLTSTRKEISQLRAQIAESKKKAERLETLHGEYETLVKKVEAIDAERRALESQMAGLRNLRSLNTGEFVVATPAKPAQYPIATTKKMILMMVFGVGFFVTFGTVASLETIHLLKGHEVRADVLGLPVIARVVEEDGEKRHRSLRVLALRLRQYLHEAGTVVLFSAVSELDQLDDMLDEVSSLLALRDERVLILDARVTDKRKTNRGQLCIASGSFSDESLPEFRGIDDENPGLSDYLSFSCNDIDQICRMGEGFGVDRIEVGASLLTTESFATHRMSELMSELKQRYSIILVAAPSLIHSVDLQILAAIADGIVAVNDGPLRARAQMLSTLAELREIEAPLLGQIVLENVVNG